MCLTAPGDNAANRSVSLDAVRAMACVMVVICHISVFQGDASLGGLRNGVMLFFGLSGYLLYRPFVLGHVNLRTYASHRIARIAPAYVLALVGITILTGDRSFVDQPLTYLLFLQNYDLKTWHGFLAVSWTLVIEVLFYLTLPALAFVIARSPTRLAALAGWSLLGALAVFFLVPSQDPRLPSSFFPLMIWAFAPGMLVALLEGRKEWAARPGTLALGIVLLAIGTQAPWLSVDIASGIGTFFVIAWAVERRPSLGVFTRAASIGAALTYSAYLWHVDLLKTIPSAPLALLALVAVSTVAYIAVERPFLRLGRYLARAPKAPVGVRVAPGRL
jgi:peptidoglycan/LPS O-acetylase OafA/YrhL